MRTVAKKSSRSRHCGSWIDKNHTVPGIHQRVKNNPSSPGALWREACRVVAQLCAKLTCKISSLPSADGLPHPGSAPKRWVVFCSSDKTCHEGKMPSSCGSPSGITTLRAMKAYRYDDGGYWSWGTFLGCSQLLCIAEASLESLRVYP